jgi:hypothetical protein
LTRPMGALREALRLPILGAGLVAVVAVEVEKWLRRLTAAQWTPGAPDADGAARAQGAAVLRAASAE